MSARRRPWTGKDTAHCLAMVPFTTGGLAMFAGYLNGDGIRVYAHIWDMVASTLPAVGISMAALVAVILLGPLYQRLLVRWLERRHHAARRVRMPDPPRPAPAATSSEAPSVVMLDGRPLTAPTGEAGARGSASQGHYESTSLARGWSLQIARAQVITHNQYGSHAQRTWGVQGKRWGQWSRNLMAA